jgi:hypothetical protein
MSQSSPDSSWICSSTGSPWIRSFEALLGFFSLQDFHISIPLKALPWFILQHVLHGIKLFQTLQGFVNFEVLLGFFPLESLHASNPLKVLQIQIHGFILPRLSIDSIFSRLSMFSFLFRLSMD